MIISYFGKQFFKVQQGEMVVAINPVSKSSKSGSLGKFGADVGFITTNHPDYNGESEISHGEREPFLVSGPGDYEVKGIFAKGGFSWAEIDGKKYANSSYSINMEGIKLGFLGVLSNKNLPKEAVEDISGSDILFVPIGNKYLGPSEAYKFALSLDPKIIIPMDYDEKELKMFLKEGGEENVESLDKLTIKKKDLEGKEGEIIVLKSA